MNSDDRWLFLFLKSTPCSCRCKHCDFAVSDAFASAKFAAGIQYVQPFVIARDTSTVPYNKMAVLFGDAPLNYSNLCDALAYLKQHEIEGWLSIPANGFRFQSDDKWLPLLETIRRAGTQILEFTLYGKKETHDWFAGRKGDYAAIHSLAHLWHELGGKTSWSIFVHKNNLTELTEIRSEILQTYGEPCMATLWAYLGHGTNLEHLRLERDDLNRVDQTVQADLESLKSESEWVAHLNTSEEPAFPADPCVMHVVVDGEGNTAIPYTRSAKGHRGIVIGRLPQSISSFIQTWKREYQAWRNVYPPVRELCRVYGNPAGTKMYDRKSVVRKWCHTFETVELSE